MNALASAADFATGKGSGDENFPVASWLLKPAHRAPILAFYAFARAADDIADHPTAPPTAKRDRLAAMAAGLDGTSAAEPTAAHLRTVMLERGLDFAHARDLLHAFNDDVSVRRYPDWDSLIAYCALSAMPVGRFVLDVHGESRATFAASDALCAALQIINHLQDCGEDYRGLDRVYLPLDMLAAAGVAPDALGAPHATPALRGVIADLADRCLELLDRSRVLSRSVADRRLGIEIAIIQDLATHLAQRLRQQDPLAGKIRHRRHEMLAIAARAALRRLVAR